MQKVSKIGLKMATGYKKCIEDRWTVKNLLVSAKGQLSTDRYKCLLQKSEKKKKILSYWSGVFHNVLDDQGRPLRQKSTSATSAFCYGAPKVCPDFRGGAKKQPVPWHGGTG